MAYPDHLLEQAKHLAKREKKKPRQASLRRAVSTAYYSLFHLLIHEAALNWKRVEQRPLLARFFEHGKMRAASERQRGEINTYLRTNPRPCPELECEWGSQSWLQPPFRRLAPTADALVSVARDAPLGDRLSLVRTRFRTGTKIGRYDRIFLPCPTASRK
jgi:hypothetical protein